MVNIKTHREYKRDISKETHYCVFCLNKVAHYWSQADTDDHPVSTSLWHCQAHREIARANLFRDHGFKNSVNKDTCSCEGDMCTCVSHTKARLNRYGLIKNNIHSVSIDFDGTGYSVTFYRAVNKQTYPIRVGQIYDFRYAFEKKAKRIVLLPSRDSMTVDYLFV